VRTEFADRIQVRELDTPDTTLSEPAAGLIH
jgi:hypothetical protein